MKIDNKNMESINYKCLTIKAILCYVTFKECSWFWPMSMELEVWQMSEYTLTFEDNICL